MDAFPISSGDASSRKNCRAILRSDSDDFNFLNINCFSKLGDTPQLRMEDFYVLEEYVCRLYNGRGRSANAVRYQLFKNKK